MERNNCVGVISYKELEIAMQRKSAVKAWNTEHSKQKKWLPLQQPNDLNLPLESITKKNNLKIYVVHFLIVFQADSFFFLFFQNCCF